MLSDVAEIILDTHIKSLWQIRVNYELALSNSPVPAIEYKETLLKHIARIDKEIEDFATQFTKGD